MYSTTERWSMTFPRQRYQREVLQPHYPRSAGLACPPAPVLVWSLSIGPSSSYSGKLCCKVSGTGYGERPLTGPYFLTCGWAQFCSRFLAGWETCTAQARPGQGGPHRAHLLCWRQSDREEGKDKAGGAKWRERGREGIGGKKKMRHKNSQREGETETEKYKTETMRKGQKDTGRCSQRP